MEKVYERTHFDYIAPEDLDSALIELKKNRGAAIIAGGTDLLPRWRAGLIQPSMLIDLKQLGLSYIKTKANRVCIGAYTTHSQMIASKLLEEFFPALTEACREIAAPPIRNRGTLGGNLVNASPAADTIPPLLAYDAEVVLVKQDSIRILPLEKFFLEAGQTIKESDELLTEVRIPLSRPDIASKFLKIGKRQAMAIAVASVAVRILLAQNGEVIEARIALGSVAPIPIRARKAESMLERVQLRDEIIIAAARKAQEEASPISDIRASKEYRSRMIEVLVKRSLKTTQEEFRRRKISE